jgi:hypothetical protein
VSAAAAAPDVRELAARLEDAERRIERLSEVIADLLGEALPEPRRQRPHLRVAK